MLYNRVMKEQRIERIAEQLAALTEKISKNAKKSSKYGTDTELYRIEIHLIQVIGNNPGMHLIDIANIFNLTKGAISQTLKRLEKKGMIYKQVYESNRTKILIYLTEKGKIAHKTHIDGHREKDKALYEFFEKLSDNQVDIITKFLDLMKEMTEH